MPKKRLKSPSPESLLPSNLQLGEFSFLTREHAGLVQTNPLNRSSRDWATVSSTMKPFFSFWDKESEAKVGHMPDQMKPRLASTEFWFNELQLCVKQLLSHVDPRLASVTWIWRSENLTYTMHLWQACAFFVRVFTGGAQHVSPNDTESFLSSHLHSINLSARITCSSCCRWMQECMKTFNALRGIYNALWGQWKTLTEINNNCKTIGKMRIYLEVSHETSEPKEVSLSRFVGEVNTEWYKRCKASFCPHVGHQVPASWGQEFIYRPERVMGIQKNLINKY